MATVAKAQNRKNWSGMTMRGVEKGEGKGETGIGERNVRRLGEGGVGYVCGCVCVNVRNRKL